MAAQQADDVAMMQAASSSSSSHRTVQAQRLMKRLETCDKQLAHLLSQTADSLQSLLDNDRDDPGEDLGKFEEVAQDWLASVYDIQWMLRKAIRFLVRSSRPPIMTATHAFVQGGGVSAAFAGTAATMNSDKVDVSSLNGNEEVNGTTQGTKEGADTKGEVELSMSALRFQHQVWEEVVASLQSILEGKGKEEGDDLHTLLGLR